VKEYKGIWNAVNAMGRPSGEYTRIHWDQEELERIKTISAKTGIKATPEIVRQAIMHEFNRVTGSLIPDGREKR
jgi:hypothetical protein